MYIYLPAYYLFPLANTTIIWWYGRQCGEKESNRHKKNSFCGSFFGWRKLQIWVRFVWVGWSFWGDYGLMGSKVYDNCCVSCSFLGDLKAKMFWLLISKQNSLCHDFFSVNFSRNIFASKIKTTLDWLCCINRWSTQFITKSSNLLNKPPKSFIPTTETNLSQTILLAFHFLNP